MSRWRFKQIKPQKARGKLHESMWTDPEWIAEEKYDGDRRIAQFCGRTIRFTGCRPSVDGSGFVEKTTNVPHLSGAWDLGPKVMEHSKMLVGQVPVFLDGTVLDGEMVARGAFHEIEGDRSGGMSKYVTSIMGSLPDEAVRKQIERGWLKYVVFDCLYYNGTIVTDLPLVKRRHYMAKAVETWGNRFVALADQCRGRDKRAYYEEVVGRGGEGVVLKSLDHIYGDEKLWVKVKKSSTADVVIMGFKDAKEMSTKKGDDQPTMTKYAAAGLIGAIVCGQFSTQPGDPESIARVKAVHTLHEVATVSGMDDDLRRELTSNGKNYIGDVIEIMHNGREPTGRFRHPRFKRFRQDKTAKNCVYDLEES